MLAAMVDARSHIVVVVAVKCAIVVASMTYDDEKARVREVEGAPVVAGHDDLKLGGAPRPRR